MLPQELDLPDEAPSRTLTHGRIGIDGDAEAADIGRLAQAEKALEGVVDGEPFAIYDGCSNVSEFKNKCWKESDGISSVGHLMEAVGVWVCDRRRQ
jgi:hypothetical protein